MSLCWFSHCSTMAAMAVHHCQRLDPHPPRRQFVRSILPARAAGSLPTRVTIRGERFDAGATVTIGGTRADVLQAAITSMDVTTPAHAAGIVDVVVTNPDGQSGRLTGGFTFEDAPEFV